MKIAITGATGFVGTKLVKQLLAQGHSIKVFSRSKKKAVSLLSDKVEVIEWNAPHGDIPKGSFTGVDALINLMGENIGGKRWSDEQKVKLRNSRVLATQKIAKAIEADLPDGIDCLVSTSAIGYYPVNLDQPLDENHPNTNSFLSSLCQDWEQSAHTIKSNRTVILRVGVVLGKGGGALAKLMPIFKLGLGGPVLPGTQMMSWIQLEDLVNLYVASVTTKSYQGTINAVTPHPVTNTEFSKALGTALSRPAVFPVPGFALKIAMGEMSTIVLDSQTIVSTKLGNLGFKFKYPKILEALQNL
ncbi:MAG: TIGR01777 family protein [Halobacteriovorax sp.]|nr:TIGR01777 family protein [Halobacteriovorax sp.]